MINKVQFHKKIRQMTTGILALFMTASSGFSYAVPVYAETVTTAAAKRKKEEKLEESTLQLNTGSSSSSLKKEAEEEQKRMDMLVAKANGKKFSVSKEEAKLLQATGDTENVKKTTEKERKFYKSGYVDIWITDTGGNATKARINISRDSAPSWDDGIHKPTTWNCSLDILSKDKDGNKKNYHNLNLVSKKVTTKENEYQGETAYGILNFEFSFTQHAHYKREDNNTFNRTFDESARLSFNKYARSTKDQTCSIDNILRHKDTSTTKANFQVNILHAGLRTSDSGKGYTRYQGAIGRLTYSKPKWKVTFTSGYGNNNALSTPQSVTDGKTMTLPSNPTRTGYKFAGWSGNTTSIVCADRTIKATWTPWTHTVHYDANGGTGAPSDQTKTYAQDLFLSNTKPTRTGYVFSKWNTKSDGLNGTEYTAGQQYKPDQDGGTVTLYAQWTPITNTIHYDANGGTGAPADQKRTYGTDLTLSSTKPTRSGYTFKGWSLTKNGTKKYDPGAQYKESFGSDGATQTLYAVWAEATHTVAYDANGGTGAPASQTKKNGVTLTLSSTKPTRTGYNFVIWNTQKNGGSYTGDRYNPGGSYTHDQEGGTVTLYAQWTPWTHTVAYNANGGSGAPASQTKTYGKDLTLSSTKPTRTGYIFTGWNTQSNGKGTDYPSGSVYRHDQNGGTVTLYAKWTPWTHIVHYDKNVPSNSTSQTVYNIPADQTKTYGQILTISNLVPTRKGYTFDGWYTRADGKGTKYTPGSIYATDQNGGTVTLYAKWTPWTYKINYDKNVSSTSSSQTVSNMPASQTKTQEVNLTLSSQKPTRNGYTFVSWNTRADGKGTTYLPGATYKEDLASNGASTTLYAVWTPWKHTLHYDKNVPFSSKSQTVTNMPSDQTKTFDQKLTLSSLTPVRSGYTFSGWNTKADGTGTTYKPGANYDHDQNGGTYTLYAVWAPWKYKINYDKNVPSTSKSQTVSNMPASQTKTHEVNLTLSSAKPTRTGYTFVSWNTRADGKGTTYLPGATYKEDLASNGASTTLYAVWTPWTHTVHYDKNVKSTSSSQTVSNMPADQTKTYEVALTLSSLKPTRNGYTFAGWNTKADGTGTSYQPGGSYTNDLTTAGGTVTLYAVWTPWKHTVHYDKNVPTSSSSQTVTNMPADQTKTFDQKLMVSTTVPVRNGYIFSGWNTKSDGSGTSYPSGSEYKHDQNGGTSTLYAQWTPWKHTVHYDKNVKATSASQTVTNMPADQTKTFDQKLSVSSLTPVRNGYIFNGWNTKEDGSGKAYKAGDDYDHDQNGGTYTLYAQWIPWKHTVHYDGNATGVSKVPADQTKIFDQKLTLSSQLPERYGYNFVSWNTKADGSGTRYYAGAEYDHDQNGGTVTLYAQWTPWKHTIHYDANGGDKNSVPADQEKTYGEKLTLSTKKPTRDEYKFIGWNTDPNGNGTSYQPGDNYDHDQNGGTETLYAQWVQLYTVVYDGNDPEIKGCVITGSVESQTQGQDENVNLRYNKFVNNSGVYKDWSVGKDAYKNAMRNESYRKYIHPEQYETNHFTMQKELFDYNGNGKKTASNAVINVEETIVQN